jgi:hypothetical protein
MLRTRTAIRRLSRIRGIHFRFSGLSHGRLLLFDEHGKIGVLDFQDSVRLSLRGWWQTDLAPTEIQALQNPLERCLQCPVELDLYLADRVEGLSSAAGGGG